MPPISGTWSFNGSYSTQQVESGNTPYKTYFAIPFESIEGTQVSKFKSYADSNGNGTYDSGDLLIGETVVQSGIGGSIGGSSGTFTSPEGSNMIYSYIGNTFVGQATFQGTNPWNVAGAQSSYDDSNNIRSQLSTTSSVDNLTGIKKSKDIFKFEVDPSGQIDGITGFRTKDKDLLSISKTAFDIDGGTFTIAKNSKLLNKQLSTDVDVVYCRKSGELILSSNGSEPGFDNDGGIFAILTGRPVLNLGSVEFY